MIIARADALIIAEQILHQAEQERLLLAEEEAKCGIQREEEDN
jgi:hypothetical protein